MRGYHKHVNTYIHIFLIHPCGTALLGYRLIFNLFLFLMVQNSSSYLYFIFIFYHPPNLVTCNTNNDCTNGEVCIQQICQNQCTVHNPCAQNAACINTAHGVDCSCVEGFQGNGFVGCLPG